MASIARELFEKDYPIESVLAIERLFDALRSTNGDDKVEVFLDEVRFQQIYALFDDRAGTLYVLGDASGIGPADELAYAGAYASGVRSQLFDAVGLREQAAGADGDGMRAVGGFISGDMFRTQQAYRDLFLSTDLDSRTVSYLSQAQLNVAPIALRSLVHLAEREATAFVSGLFKSGGGWDAIDSAYSRPPVSTEQILHVEKYLAGEEPITVDIPNLWSGLGEGWVDAGSDVMGEFLMRYHLEEYLDPEQASAVAAGWSGDRYTLSSGPDGERVLALLAGWDSVGEASEFFAGYQAFWEAKTGGSSGVSLGDGNWKLVTA